MVKENSLILQISIVIRDRTALK